MSGSAIPTTTYSDADFTVVKAVKVRVFRTLQRQGRDGLDYFVVFTCATPGVITNDRIVHLVSKDALANYAIGDTYTVDVYTAKNAYIQKYDNFVKV